MFEYDKIVIKWTIWKWKDWTEGTSKVDCFRLSYLSLIPHHLVSFTHTSYLTKAYSASSWQFLVHFHPFHSSIRVKFAFKFEYFDQQKSRKRVPLSKRPTKEYSNFNFRSWKTLVFHIHQTIFSSQSVCISFLFPLPSFPSTSILLLTQTQRDSYCTRENTSSHITVPFHHQL